MFTYDYGNARLRAMKSRLLSRQELEILAEVGDLRGLITALTKTTYREPIENALARTSGLDCIHEALRSDLTLTIGKVRGFYSGQSGEMVAIWLRLYDIQNLRAILRGLSRNASPTEILAVLVPVGDLTLEVLSELARAPSPRGAIDLMASLGLPFAHPLLQLRVEKPDAETFEMELALEKWYYRHSFQQLEGRNTVGELLRSALKLEADIANLLTILRFASAPTEREYLSKWVPGGNVRYLLVGPGSLSFDLLERVAEEGNLQSAIEHLEDTPYKRSLRSGLEAYTRSKRLSEFERHLKRYRLEWMTRQITRDPLGIGVPLGYLALKVNEVSNIRHIAYGIVLGLKKEEIKAELEFVA